MQSTVHRQTEYTPYRSMLWQEVIQPKNFVTCNIPGNLSPQTTDEQIAYQNLRLAEAHACARQNLKQTQHRQKGDYDCESWNIITVTDIWCTDQTQPLKLASHRTLGHPGLGHTQLLHVGPRAIPVCLRRLRHQYFQTDDSSGSQQCLEDHVDPFLPDSEVDTSNRELELHSGIVDNRQPYPVNLSNQSRSFSPAFLQMYRFLLNESPLQFC